jgi:ABC-type sugar transport system permease subunit
MEIAMTTDQKKSLVAYVYIAPFYILFAIFGLFPMISGFFLSFFRWDAVSRMRFLGLENYINLLTDPLFHTALSNTLIIGIIAHIPILLGGLTLAFILNSQLVRFKEIFKTVYFMPMVTSAVAITVIFQNIFNYNYGMVNYMLKSFGFESFNWLGGNGTLIKPVVIFMFAWKWIGWNMVIYLAGMQGISMEIYEAAIIDGAGHGRIFFHITIPLLKPIILFTLIQSTVGMFSLYTEPVVLVGTGGGANNSGLTLMMYLLNKAPMGGILFGYASACAYVITIMIIIISMMVTRIMSEQDSVTSEVA